MGKFSRLLGVAATAATGFGMVQRKRMIDAVAPELRNRQLWLPLSLRGPRSLKVGRSMMAKQGVVAATCGVRADTATHGDGNPTPVLVYENEGRTTPSGALLWIHGGGLVMGAADQGNEVCSRFVNDLGIVVVSVDYRLAPEHPFPAGLDDCYTALAWMHDNAARLGIDVSRIAIGGDSAGGALAASLAQMAHDRGGPAVCFQLLQYPMLDDRTALRRDIDALLWSNTSNRYAWSAYLGHAAGDDDVRPYAVPARRLDMSGLPPAWIGVGDIDLFHDEDVAYAERLRAAHVPCDLHVVPGMYHAAERFSARAPSMVDFVDRMVAALRSALQR